MLWPILFVTGIVTACLFTGVSVLMRMKFPDRRRPEWMLAGLLRSECLDSMSFSEPVPDI